MEQLILKGKIIGARLLSLIIFIGAIGLTGLILVDAWGVLSHKTWEATTGTVIENSGYAYRTKGGTYWATFAYRYTAVNQTYTGEQVWFFERFAGYSEEEWESFLEAHPLDSQITILYNPLFKRQAIIDPTVESRTWLGIVLASCAIIPGFLILLALGAALWGYGKNQN